MANQKPTDFGRFPRPPDRGIAGPPGGHTGVHALLGGAHQARTRPCRSSSVTVRETADGAHRPSWGTVPVRHMSVNRPWCHA
jgi:hypothetical protein